MVNGHFRLFKLGKLELARWCREETLGTAESANLLRGELSSLVSISTATYLGAQQPIWETL
jgi:hypothetical protein